MPSCVRIPITTFISKRQRRGNYENEFRLQERLSLRLDRIQDFRWTAWRRPGEGMACGPQGGGGGGPDAGRTPSYRGQFGRRNLRRRGGQRVSVSRKRKEQTDGSRTVCIGGRTGRRRRSGVSQWPGAEGRQSGGSRERQSPRQGEAGTDTEQKGKAPLGSRRICKWSRRARR